MATQHQTEIEGLRIVYSYSKAYPGTYVEPPEPAEVAIDGVYADDLQIDDFLELYGFDFESLEERVLIQHNEDLAATADQYCDDDHEKNEL